MSHRKVAVSENRLAHRDFPDGQQLENPSPCTVPCDKANPQFPGGDRIPGSTVHWLPQEPSCSFACGATNGLALSEWPPDKIWLLGLCIYVALYEVVFHDKNTTTLQKC